MSTRLLYLSQIRTAIPGMQFEQVEQAGGQFNDVMIVNGEWIFRFPRFREGVERMIAEMHLLEGLRGRLPLPIPDPVYQRFDPPVPGLAFMGYQRLPGEPFHREALAQVNDEWIRNDLAGQLASFLRSLHSLPLHKTGSSAANTAPLNSTAAWRTGPLGLQRVPPPTGPLPALTVDPTVHDGREEWARMYTGIREKLFPSMRLDARRAVTTLFESYLDDSTLHSFTPTLRHGDFGGSNILWDPQAGRITAIIDFSFCALGDPAMDLASVSTLGTDFFDRLAPRYEADEARCATMLARARFYRGTFALIEALAGLRDNDNAAYQHGMEDYV